MEHVKAAPKLIITLSILATVALGGEALAASISGPTGQLINGWFKDSVAARVQADPILNCAYVGIGSSELRFSEGIHTYEVLQTDNKSTYWRMDDGTLYSIRHGCSQPGGSIIWSAVVKLDISNPVVSVNTPANNTNTGSSTIVVNGTVSDVASGVASVKVNNVAAQLSGGSFTATVPLTIGLNSIWVVATDNVSHTTTAPLITVLRQHSQAGGSSPSTSPDSDGGNSVNSGDPSVDPTPASSVLADASSGSPSAGSERTQPSPSQPSTLVKGATYAGVGVQP
jgi:hypothetical protein